MKFIEDPEDIYDIAVSYVWDNINSETVISDLWTTLEEEYYQELYNNHADILKDYFEDKLLKNPIAANDDTLVNLIDNMTNSKGVDAVRVYLGDMAETNDEYVDLYEEESNIESDFFLQFASDMYEYYNPYGLYMVPRYVASRVLSESDEKEILNQIKDYSYDAEPKVKELIAQKLSGTDLEQVAYDVILEEILPKYI